MGEHPRADRASRIIDILGFTPDPFRTPEEMLSRANLLTELHRHSILKEVPPAIATIFKCLEQVSVSCCCTACERAACRPHGLGRPQGRCARGGQRRGSCEHEQAADECRIAIRCICALPWHRTSRRWRTRW
jgi:hypothetical protein